MNRAIVVIGSLTSEDTYGVDSGKRVSESLDRAGWMIETIHASEIRRLVLTLIEQRPDVVVPVGFGPPLEDGRLYSLCQMLGVPCAGPSATAGSIMQDKSIFELIVRGLFGPESGVRPPIGCCLQRSDSASHIESCVARLSPPLVVKPAYGGSSGSLFVFQDRESATGEVQRQLASEGKVLVQQLETRIMLEISCTVLDRLSGPVLLPIVELKRDDVKVLGPVEKFGPTANDRHVIPARLSEGLHKRISNVVLSLHRALSAVGLTRTDIIITEREEVVVLEMNGIPGLLATSIACDSAKAAGMGFESLCLEYAETAKLDRFEQDIWSSLPSK